MSVYSNVNVSSYGSLFAKGSGAWIELGRTTLGSPNANIDVTGLADKRYYMILTHIKGSSADTNKYHRVGNGSFDTGSNYSARWSGNGVSDATNSNTTVLTQSNTTESTQHYSVSHIANFSTDEKLHQSHSVTEEILGDGTPPTRSEAVSKWRNVSNPLDRIRATPSSANTWDTGSEMVILGWDEIDKHLTDANFWQELVKETLITTDSNVQLTVAAKKYLWIQAYMKPTATLVPWLRFNNISTGTPYADRSSDNGASDGTNISQNQMIIGLSESTPQFVNIFIINVSANEKLVICNSVGQNAAGEANTPTRRDTVAKWDSVSSQITEIDFVTSTSTFASGSRFQVWGAD